MKKNLVVLWVIGFVIMLLTSGFSFAVAEEVPVTSPHPEKAIRVPVTSPHPERAEEVPVTSPHPEKEIRVPVTSPHPEKDSAISKVELIIKILERDLSAIWVRRQLCDIRSDLLNSIRASGQRIGNWTIEKEKEYEKKLAAIGKEKREETKTEKEIRETLSDAKDLLRQLKK